MKDTQVVNIVRSIAGEVGIDPNLAHAVATVESRLDPSVARYEENFHYILTPERFAKLLGITTRTETEFQRCSWGVMQVMGAVARELNYQAQLPLLLQPQLGALYGCRKLHSVLKKYSDLSEAIASYNSGSPIRKNGILINQTYVDKVMERLIRLKKTR
jgi:soluble lytic murein transglycosylase-like protein